MNPNLQVVLKKLIATNLFSVVNFLTTCYVQTISDLLEQLVASLLPHQPYLTNRFHFAVRVYCNRLRMSDDVIA